MIEPTGVRCRCDHAGCVAELRADTETELRDRGAAVGWTFNRRADGEPAVRNGKDYCLVHRRGWHLLDGLTETMAARLLALLDDPTWRPRGPGEWRTARVMHDRGLLWLVAGPGPERFELNDAGRRAALEIKGRRAEQIAAVTPVNDEDGDSEENGDG